jgi:hypothetical protein
VKCEILKKVEVTSSSKTSVNFWWTIASYPRKQNSSYKPPISLFTNKHKTNYKKTLKAIILILIFNSADFLYTFG